MLRVKGERLGTLICAGIVTLALAGSTKATLITSESLIADDIEYYIRTDKSVYALGEDVEILLRITNLRNEERTFGYMPPLLDILVAAKEGENFRTVWFSSWDRIVPAGPAVVRLQPGESVELNGIWPQLDLNDSWEIKDHAQVSAGSYAIGGRIGRSRFNDTISSAPVSVEVAVIPEPASLILFALGLPIGRYFNRRSKV
jgi:hypothetical protein